MQMIHHSLDTPTISLADTLKTSERIDEEAFPQNVMFELDELRPKNCAVTNRQAKIAGIGYPRRQIYAVPTIPFTHLWNKLIKIFHSARLFKRSNSNMPAQGCQRPMRLRVFDREKSWQFVRLVVISFQSIGLIVIGWHQQLNAPGYPIDATDHKL